MIINFIVSIIIYLIICNNIKQKHNINYIYYQFISQFKKRNDTNQIYNNNNKNNNSYYYNNIVNIMIYIILLQI